MAAGHCRNGRCCRRRSRRGHWFAVSTRFLTEIPNMRKAFPVTIIIHAILRSRNPLTGAHAQTVAHIYFSRRIFFAVVVTDTAAFCTLVVNGIAFDTELWDQVCAIVPNVATGTFTTVVEKCEKDRIITSGTRCGCHDSGRSRCG